VVHEAGGRKVGFKRTMRDRNNRPVYRVREKNGKRRRCLKMTTEGGIVRLLQMLGRFFADKRIAAHQGNSDLEWLLAHGLDLRHRWIVPPMFQHMRPNTPAEAERGVSENQGPLDTALMAHSIDETGDFTLTGQTIRYTEAPRYDVRLQRWRDEYCKANGLKASELEGYGDCPDDVLYPYGSYDSDVTRRIALVHIRNLSSDQFGNDCWEAYWMSMQAALPCLEINTTGILLDKKRVDEMTSLYMDAKRQLGERIREWANWRKLNLESRFQVAELLFGERYNGHEKQTDGTIRRLRPEGAKTVGALPVLTTDKRPKPWEEVMAAKKEDDYTASTNKQVLGMLVHNAKKLRCFVKTRRAPGGEWLDRDRSGIIGWIRDYRFTSQVLKSVLRNPETADDGVKLQEDEDGNWVYSKGIAGSVCTDGRVRTFISQLKETGRWSSSRPPLQNISKRRECYSDDTEFLTERGWLRGRELQESDLVAQYVADTDRIEFVSPSRIVSYDYTGPMVHLKSHACDLLVTPEHRCLVQSPVTGHLQEFAAKDLPETGKQLVAGVCEQGDTALAGSQVVLLAATQACGHWSQDYLEFGLTERRKWLRLKSALDVLEINYTGLGRPGGDLRIRVSAKTNKEFTPWLRRILDDGSRFVAAMLTELDSATRLLLAEEVLLWNGPTTRGNNCYISPTKGNRDFVHALFTLVGWHALSVDEDGKVCCCDNRSSSVRIDAASRLQQDYCGKVYCVTVPSSWVVVRRNGRVAVSGNSDYKRILESLELEYPGALRSIFKADEDYVLVEADYTGAELYGMAIMSGDKQMIDHARRNILPEEDPDFYDIHSNIAVRAFNLKCPPTKGGLADIGKKHLRIVAKSVIFGVAYGRGAKAIAIAAKEEGVEVTEADAQAVIDAIFAMYPGLVDFFEECRARAVTQEGADEEAPRWLCNPFGRFRRFPVTDDFKVRGDLERQAQNFPIQSMIADAVSLAVYNIYAARKDSGLDYRIVLQIHDAVILLVHKDHVNEVCSKILPRCMEEMVAIYRADLSGMPDEASPAYRLGVDIGCSTHWGIMMMPDECWDLGFDAEHTGWKRHSKVEGGWVNPEAFGGKVWLESDKELHKPEEVLSAI